MARIVNSARFVVLLTTWDRPRLLAQSLPQIERETASIGASLMICDDRSSDPETLQLITDASARGARVIRRPDGNEPDRRVPGLLHADPRSAIRVLLRTTDAAEMIARSARETGDMRRVLRPLWRRAWEASYCSTQENNLFGFRYALSDHPQADWILKVDDDVVLDDGAFAKMFDTWSLAEADGTEPWAVSGIRTSNERLRATRPGYGITQGACNVAILYRAEDWREFLRVIPARLVIDKGFDLAFAWDYAPCYRGSAVPVCVIPSAAYHAGRNGLNVRDRDLNCDYAGDTDAIVVL